MGGGLGEFGGLQKKEREGGLGGGNAPPTWNLGLHNNEEYSIDVTWNESIICD